MHTSKCIASRIQKLHNSSISWHNSKMHIVRDYTIEGDIAQGIPVQYNISANLSWISQNWSGFQSRHQARHDGWFLPNKNSKEQGIAADGLFIQVVAHVQHKKSVRFFASLSAPWLVLLAPNVDWFPSISCTNNVQC